MKSLSIPILINITQDILIPTAVAFSSLLRHSSVEKEFEIYVLFHPNDLPKQQRQQLSAWFEGDTRLNFNYVDVADQLSGSFQDRGIPSAAYYRLFAAKLLPHLEQIIYVDVDMVFRNDFTQLYPFDFGQNLMAGVKDSSTLYESGRKRIESIGANPSTYVNAGFMLLNLAGMRQIPDFTQQVETLMGKAWANMDQDIINILCNGYTVNLPQLYNYTNSCYTLAFKQITDSGISPSVSEELISNVHYTGAKPWSSVCYRDDFWWEEYRYSPCFDSVTYFEHFHANLGADSMSIPQICRYLKTRLFQRLRRAIKAK